MSPDGVDRRDFLKAAGGAAAAASIAGCTDGGGGSGGTLVYARGDHPENYDPQQTTSGEVSKVTNQIFDTLIQFEAGSGGALEEGLASDWSLEGQSVTLTLKEDVTFHNGENFTAEDFKATFRRFTDAEYDYYLGDTNRSGYGPFTLGDWVESVDASDDYEMELSLTQEYAPMLRNLAMFAAAVLSKAQIESLGEAPAVPEGETPTEDNPQIELGTDPVGTGPFEFDSLNNSDQRVRLTAYDDFWGPGPNVDEVVFKTIQENSTRVQDVINGASHITDNLDADGFQQAQDAGSAELLRKNGINQGYMAMNMARKEEFRDRNVRLAVSYAVNTEVIVDDIYQGFAAQSDQPTPPDVLGHNDDIEPYPTDKEQAQALLVEAGYPDGFELELATFSNPRGYNPSPIQTANQVKSDLEAIGLTVNINQFESFNSYLDYTAQGKHDACFLGWYTDNADPDNFLYVLCDPKVDLEAVPEGQDWVSFDTEGYSTLNVSGWANTEFMEMVRNAQESYDDEERRSTYEEANQLVHDEAPWVFIDYAETLRAVNEQVVADSYTVSSVGGPYLNTVELQ